MKKLKKETAKILFGNYSQLGDRSYNLMHSFKDKDSTEEDEHTPSAESVEVSSDPVFVWLKDTGEAEEEAKPEPMYLLHYWFLISTEFRSRHFFCSVFSYLNCNFLNYIILYVNSMKEEYVHKLLWAYSPLCYFMIATGRMPFSGEVNTRSGRVEITLSRKSWRFILFCLTSLVLIYILISSSLFTFVTYGEYAERRVDQVMAIQLREYETQQGLNITNTTRTLIPPYLYGSLTLF